MGAGEEHYYVYPNGDGTWTLHRHARHPDVKDERGPYDADELLEALKEYGFDREEIAEKKIEGLDISLALS
jgi:hypothetical protein